MWFGPLASYHLQWLVMAIDRHGRALTAQREIYLVLLLISLLSGIFGLACSRLTKRQVDTNK